MPDTQNSAHPLPGHIAELFVSGLLDWNKKENSREMPWKGEKDPYRIWLSEVILQQTRVQQGMAYYNRFIEKYPTVDNLAAAPESEVFKLWEGLGYYSRCKNLIEAAKTIVSIGKFPSTYTEILALKGVGPYTAAAIASFAFNHACAVLDGNVYRVLARIFNVATPIDSNPGKKQFGEIAQSLLPSEKAGEYNQAIMDFGATICKPVPECHLCFFRPHCKAYKNEKAEVLPVKEKKTVIKTRFFHYFILTADHHILLRQRTDNDIWQQLHEPLLIESGKKLSLKQMQLHLEKIAGINKTEYFQFDLINEISQRLTHQLIHFRFVHIQMKNKPAVLLYNWLSFQQAKQLAMPRTIKEVLHRLI